MNNILIFLFSKLPVLKLLDGYKTIIGRVLLLAAVVLPATQAAFPQLVWLGQVNDYVLMVAAWLGIEIGNAHKNAKTEMGVK